MDLQLKVRQRNKVSGTRRPIKKSAALKFHFASLADGVDTALCSIRILMTIPFNVIPPGRSTVPLCLSSDGENKLNSSSEAFYFLFGAVLRINLTADTVRRGSRCRGSC